MKKTFIRSFLEDGTVECSWYNTKGKRYQHETSNIVFENLSVKQTDDEYGFMAYARVKGFDIIDDYQLPQPKSIKF